MFPLVLIGLGLFLIAAAGEKKPRPPSEPKPLPPELAAVFDQIAGQLVYKPEVAGMTIASLHYRYATPPPDNQPGVVIITPGPGTPIGPDDWGAYWALQGLHAEGYDIWVPINFHLPAQIPHAVAYVRPGEGAQAAYAGYALLIAANQSWPVTAA